MPDNVDLANRMQLKPQGNRLQNRMVTKQLQDSEGWNMTGTAYAYAQETNLDTRWQQLLDSYCEYEQRHKRLLQWRALGFAILIYSVFLLFFLTSAASHFHSYWLTAAIAGFFTALPLTLYCQLALRRIMRLRRNLSRELYSAGLRIDEEYQLLTNSAYPRLVARTGNMAVEL